MTFDAHTKACFDVYAELDPEERASISGAARRRAFDVIAKKTSSVLEDSPSAFAHLAGLQEQKEFNTLMESEYGPRIREREAKSRQAGLSAPHWTLLRDAYDRLQEALGPKRKSLRPRRPGVVRAVEAMGVIIPLPKVKSTSAAQDEWEANRE